MEALADAAGISPFPFDTADIGSVPTRLESLSDKLDYQANCVNFANIELLQEGMRNLETWVRNGPLLPCHYRLKEILSKHDISHAAEIPDESSRLLPVGNGNGGRSEDERELFTRAFAELRDVNTKLQSGVDFST